MLELKTGRLLLRDLLLADFEAIHALRSDPDVTRYMDYIKSDTEEETRDWLAGTMRHNALSPRQSYNLAVVRQSDGEILGWVGIGEAEDGRGSELDFGYALLPEHWGQGYATEALKAVIDFAFEHLGIHTIYGECHVENVASARVMEKAGLSRLCRDGEDLLFVIQK